MSSNTTTKATTSVPPGSGSSSSSVIENEKWIFSLPLPPPPPQQRQRPPASGRSSPPTSRKNPFRVVELVTTHPKFHNEPTSSSRHNLQQQQPQGPLDGTFAAAAATDADPNGNNDDVDDDDDDAACGDSKVGEIQSLLDDYDDSAGEEHHTTNNNNSKNIHDASSSSATSVSSSSGSFHPPPYCWRFYSPVYGMELQSSTLLRLSYRPAYQGIPEYTKGQRRRRVCRALLTSCCCGGCGYGPTDDVDHESSLEVAEEDDQIWEVYSTRHIVRHKKIELNIRGMGTCQAVQIFLKPPLVDDAAHDVNLDHIMVPPRKYQPALNMHKQRMEGQVDSGWTRFSGPGDTLSLQPKEEEHPPPSDKNDDKKDDDDDDLIVVTFAVPLSTEAQHDPPLLWKVDVPPQRRGHDMVLDTITVLDGSVDLQEPSTHVFVQGYQSWSYAGSVWKGQKQPTSAMMNVFSKAFNLGGCLPTLPTTILPLGCHQQHDLFLCTTPDASTRNVVAAAAANKTSSSMAANGTTPTNSTSNMSTTNNAQRQSQDYPPLSFRGGGTWKPKSFPYKSDFFACVTTGRDQIMDEDGGPALICGWLSQHHQFGVVSIDKNLQNVTMHATHQAIPKGRVTTDWAFAQLVSPHHYDEECMVHFLHAAASYNQAKPLQNGPLLTGWCSWYHYYENISEENLRSNFGKLAAMKDKVPTNVAVVDDGYMTAWGDWDSLKPKRFTDMSVVARDISQSRMRPGLWLAPFAADKHSKIVRDYPEWIIRNDRGVPANSSNCGKFFYGLDATNPQVRDHAFQAIRRAVQDWGFQVLKIDFLYAACLEGNGKYDMSLSRAEAMHLALQTIREAAGPDVFLIGCGCPIGTAIGYVDGMRVSADTGPSWYPAPPLPWWDNGTLPSVRAMIRNSICRASMGHRFWLNDPDCLLLRESTNLTDEEVISAASIIAMTCGMMLISDDLTKVSLKRMKLLTQIFPMTGVSAVVLDLHTTKNAGMPSLLRLWCTDRYGWLEAYRESTSFRQSLAEDDFDFNAEATHFGRESAFNYENGPTMVRERHRSCIHVANGLGTWTVVSVSNWADQPQIMNIPRLAITSPPETGWTAREDVATATRLGDDEEDGCGAGFHVFSFWSSRYSWLSLESPNGNSDSSAHPISRRLLSHETEIFHIRKVTPGIPQYVGSDLHFSCGHEVLSFNTKRKNCVTIHLKTELARVGHVYLFIPAVDTSHVQCSVGGRPTRWSVTGNVPDDVGPGHCCGRIIRIMVLVHADNSEGDGQVVVDY